jgi:hypothetical protein
MFWVDGTLSVELLDCSTMKNPNIYCHDNRSLFLFAPSDFTLGVPPIAGIGTCHESRPLFAIEQFRPTLCIVICHICILVDCVVIVKLNLGEFEIK